MQCDDATDLTGRCHCGRAGWRFKGQPDSVTACNCTLCRRYGALWIYGNDGVDVAVEGPTAAYRNERLASPHLETVFCPTCAGVLAWRGLKTNAEGRRRMGLNVRMADPERIADLPIDHFDGLDRFDDLPRDGRCVRDLWF